MDKFNNYQVNFTECGTAIETRPEKVIRLRKVCVPKRTNETKTECASLVAFDRDCDEYTIYAEDVMEQGVQLQCYVECSVSFTPISASAAVTTYPTFVITLAALLFALILTSKRSH